MNSKDWDAALSVFVSKRVRGIRDDADVKDLQKLLPEQDPKKLAAITSKAQKDFLDLKGPRPMSEKAKRRWDIRIGKSKVAQS